MIQNSDIDLKLVVAIHFSHFDPGYYIWATFRKPQKVKLAKKWLMLEYKPICKYDSEL